MQMPPIRTETSPASTPFDMTVEAQVVDEDGFGMFGARMLNAPEFQFELVGTVDISMLHGLLNIRGLQLKKEIRMEGTSSDRHLPIHLNRHR